MAEPETPDSIKKKRADADPAAVAAAASGDTAAAGDSAPLPISPDEGTTKIVELPELAGDDDVATLGERQAEALIEPPEIAQTRVIQRNLRPDFIADSSGQFESLRIAESTEVSGSISRYGVRHGGEETDNEGAASGTRAKPEPQPSSREPQDAARSLPEDFDYDLGIVRRSRKRKLAALLLLMSLAIAIGLAGYALWLLLNRFL